MAERLFLGDQPRHASQGRGFFLLIPTQFDLEWPNSAWQHMGEGSYFRVQPRHCMLHICIARFVSESQVSCLTWLMKRNVSSFDEVCVCHSQHWYYRLEIMLYCRYLLHKSAVRAWPRDVCLGMSPATCNLLYYTTLSIGFPVVLRNGAVRLSVHHVRAHTSTTESSVAVLESWS